MEKLHDENKNDELLEGISIERDGDNFNLRYPDNARRTLNLQEVLLWQILQELKGLSKQVSEPVPAPQESK
jgi:hypothetical protein